ncbi:hypothetical protein TRFO_35044 [Tritrichomonas foetus]|uniref:Uncharacterized protein n=1 Tax=Tritrichomonas foetus TaxID=1144522 RepID=A0A1J4JH93_9EUKA|nr:hypothetical protein TRFO_35044 [Tritrichomonas foetus]|eukprot:OHS98514.1 hypothetical protein TRFO_35044 [Tritrichomonas foetus]
MIFISKQFGNCHFNPKDFISDLSMLDNPDGMEPKINPNYSQYGITAIEYTPDFKISDLDPQPGDIFRFYVDEKYTNYSHPPLGGRVIYGAPYYAPESDISAISSHVGCLFQYHKRKSTSHRRLNTIRNALEISLCGEAEYHRRAQIIQFPLEAHPKGVLLTICIDYAPPSFPQCNRNGLRSRDLHDARPFSMRVSHFWLVSEFDEPIIFKRPQEYMRQKYLLPTLKEVDSNHTILIEFNTLFISQFLTRLNLINGLFSVYRFFFTAKNKKYELTGNTKCFLTVLEVTVESSTPEIAKRRDVQGETITTCELSEFQILPDGFIINDYKFEGISEITLIQIVAVKSGKKDKLK